MDNCLKKCKPCKKTEMIKTAKITKATRNLFKTIRSAETRKYLVKLKKEIKENIGKNLNDSTFIKNNEKSDQRSKRKKMTDALKKKAKSMIKTIRKAKNKKNSSEILTSTPCFISTNSKEKRSPETNTDNNPSNGPIPYPKEGKDFDVEIKIMQKYENELLNSDSNLNGSILVRLLIRFTKDVHNNLGPLSAHLLASKLGELNVYQFFVSAKLADYDKLAQLLCTGPCNSESTCMSFLCHPKCCSFIKPIAMNFNRRIETPILTGQTIPYSLASNNYQIESFQPTIPFNPMITQQIDPEIPGININYNMGICPEDCPSYCNPYCTPLCCNKKLCHKNWKARTEGYSQLDKLITTVDEIHGFNEYIDIFKRVPFDTNLPAQEKALEIILKILQISTSLSKQISRELTPGIVTKCLNSKPKIKNISFDILLQFIENEDQNIVIESLKTGLNAKQPKIISACIDIFSNILKNFGPLAVPYKSFIEDTVKSLEHGDKSVRDSAKNLIIELYKWLKDGIKIYISDIKPVQLKEFEEEFKNVCNEKPTITRQIGGMKVQQINCQISNNNEIEKIQDEIVQSIDSYQLIEAVDVLSKIPDDFYNEVIEAKWQTRKESLDKLQKILNVTKMSNGDFNALVSVLRTVIASDNNINVVHSAVKCVDNLAKGLRTLFTNHATFLLSNILDKFKEKRASVVETCRSTIDSLCECLNNIDAVFDIITPYLTNKSPSIKEEVIRYIGRTINKFPEQLQRAIVKNISIELAKVLEDGSQSVREAGFETLSHLMCIVGEKNVSLYLDNLDDLKKAKLNETFLRISSIKSASTPEKSSTSKPMSVPVKQPPQSQPSVKNEPSLSQATAPSKTLLKPLTPKAIKPIKRDYTADQNDPSELDCSENTATCKAKEQLGEELFEMLSQSVWKERLKAYEEFAIHLEKLDAASSDFTPLMIFRILGIKPGWKDTNFQVTKVRFNIISLISKKFRPFPLRIIHESIQILAEKISDPKLKEQVYTTLSDLCEASSINYVSYRIATAYTNTKNIKNQAETFLYLNKSIEEFGLEIDLKFFVAFAKTSLESPNPDVKKSIIIYLTTLYLYIGSKIRELIDDLKPALLQMIDAEFEKIKGQKPPPPTRIPTEPELEVFEDESNCNVDLQKSQQPNEMDIEIETLFDRVDISNEFTPELFEELGGKNWKLRNAALEKISQTISTAKYITPNLGDLISCLGLRFNDTNKNLIVFALNVCKDLIVALGKPIHQYKDSLLPQIFRTLSDGKIQIRTAATNALTTWVEITGLTAFLDGDDTPLIEGLKINNSTSRCEINNWLSVIISGKKISSKLLIPLLEPILTCSTDRNAETRKSVQLSIRELALHIGVDIIQKSLNSCDSSTQNLLKGVLETAASQINQRNQAIKSEAKSKIVSKKINIDTSVIELTIGEIENKKEVTRAISIEVIKKTENIETTTTSITPEVEQIIESPLIYKQNSQVTRLKEQHACHLPSCSKEFFAYINSQMSVYISQNIHSNLFDIDFKKQSIGIENVISIVTDPPKSTEYEALLECSDLIIGYVGARITDGNPRIVAKCFELIEKLFSFMIFKNKKLLNEEIDYIIPPLIVRLGDNKESVRKSSQTILNLCFKLYPVASVLGYLVSGCESKISKVRSESLNLINNILQGEAITIVNLPNVSKLCLEIAKILSDRDSSSRIACLNFFSFFYSQVGEKVYDYTGSIGDKERALLKERIKRLPKPDLNKTFDVGRNLGGNLDNSMLNNSDQSEQLSSSKVAETIENHGYFDLNVFLKDLGIDIKEQPLEPTPALIDFDQQYKYRTINIQTPQTINQIDLNIFISLRNKIENSQFINSNTFNDTAQNLPILFDNCPLSMKTINAMCFCAKFLLKHLLISLSTDEQPRELLKNSFLILNCMFYSASFVHSIDQNFLKDMFVYLLELLDFQFTTDSHLKDLSLDLIKATSKSLMCLISDLIPLHVLIHVFLSLAFGEKLLLSSTKKHALKYCINTAIKRVKRGPIPVFVDIEIFLTAYNDSTLLSLYSLREHDCSDNFIECKVLFDCLLVNFITYLNNRNEKIIINNLEITHPNVYIRLNSIGQPILSEPIQIKDIIDVYEDLFQNLRQSLEKRISITTKLCHLYIEHNISFFTLDKFRQLEPSLRTFLRIAFCHLMSERINTVFKLFESNQSEEKTKNFDCNSTFYMERAKLFVQKMELTLKKFSNGESNKIDEHHPHTQPINQTIKDLVDKAAVIVTATTTSPETTDNSKSQKNIEDLRRRLENIKKGFR
ncbi:hypothetical protein HZS_2647, partial [Henneguya salminicola]